MNAATSAEQREAQEMLTFFTKASEGEAVMDGSGVIWHHSEGFWYAGNARHRKVAAIDLARALCPDIAELMAVSA